MDALKSSETLAALFETSQYLTDLKDLPSLLNNLVEHASQILGTQHGCIYLFDRKQEDLELSAVKNLEIPLGSRLRLGEGMAGQVAQNKTLMQITDYRTWEGRSDQFAEELFTSVLEVPMLFAGDLIGVLAVIESPPILRKFSEEETRVLSLFAAQAAGAVHSAHLFAKEHRHAAQLSKVHEASLAISRISEPKEKLKFLFNLAVETLHADQAYFLRFNPDTNHLTFDLHSGFNSTLADCCVDLQIQIDNNQDLFNRVFLQNSPIIVPNLMRNPGFNITNEKFYSGLFVPVSGDIHVLGVICAYSKRKAAFNSEDERLLQIFATQAAGVIENAYLQEETERRIKQVQAQWTIDKAIAHSLDMREMLKIFLEQATHQLEFDGAVIHLVDKTKGKLEIAATHGQSISEKEGTTRKFAGDTVGQAVNYKQIITKDDIHDSKIGNLSYQQFNSKGFKSYYAVPLIAKDVVNGVLELFHSSEHTVNDAWLEQLRALADQAAIAIDSIQSYISRQNAFIDLTKAYDTAVDGWVRALDLRDKETESHSIRVTRLSLLLAHAMGLRDNELINIRRGAMLHDIGKIGVPDEILHKPGSLTARESKIMHKHPLMAYDLLAPISFLQQAMEIPYCHHEKWDGSGYPRGLKGKEIPLSARIFAVTDVWDALLFERPYKNAWSEENARNFILKQAGKHFDPGVVEVFINLLDNTPQISDVAAEFEKHIKVRGTVSTLSTD